MDTVQDKMMLMMQHSPSTNKNNSKMTKKMGYNNSQIRKIGTTNQQIIKRMGV